MAIKERPITINGITFNNFEEFRDYVFAHQATRESSIREIRKKLKSFEDKYQMSTDEFVQEVVGTPADDTPDFIRWLCHYKSYCELTNGKE